MSLTDQLNDDLKAAMRGGDTVARETIRSAMAALKNKRIELGKDLEETDVLAVLGKCVKSREDSVEQYAKAGREDLAEKERAEIAVLKGYLPAMLSEDETRALVQELIAELGIGSKKEFGKLMKVAMERHRGRIDGKTVQRIAGETLS